jgi:hypothetical protein
MTSVARARLRNRLILHFANVAEEDVAELAEGGFDTLGRPTA